MNRNPIDDTNINFSQQLNLNYISIIRTESVAPENLAYKQVISKETDAKGVQRSDPGLGCIAGGFICNSRAVFIHFFILGLVPFLGRGVGELWCVGFKYGNDMEIQLCDMKLTWNRTVSLPSLQPKCDPI